MTPKEMVNERLGAVRAKMDALSALDAAYAEEIKGLQQRFAPDKDRLKVELEVEEKALEKLLKDHHSDVFGSGDSVSTELEDGTVIFERYKHVRRPRGLDMVKTLEQLGYTDAVLIKKSADWDVIDGYPDAKLMAIGTERTTREKYGWNIRREETENG